MKGQSSLKGLQSSIYKQGMPQEHQTSEESGLSDDLVRKQCACQRALVCMQGIVSVAHDVVNNWFVTGGFDGTVKVSLHCCETCNQQHMRTQAFTQPAAVINVEAHRRRFNQCMESANLATEIVQSRQA